MQQAAEIPALKTQIIARTAEKVMARSHRPIGLYWQLTTAARAYIVLYS